MLPRGITLYYIRHGETDWNAVQRYQGQTDIPLNAKGRGQAARNGRVLAEHLGVWATQLDYVASPLSRASETMRFVRGELGLAPDAFRRDARLQEQHYGHWEGELWGELPKIDPQGYAERAADKWGWCPRGGESYAMLSQRIAGWLGEVKETAVVASHGAVSRVLRGLVLPISRDEIPTLDVPQDRIMVVRAGSVEWL